MKEEKRQWKKKERKGNIKVCGQDPSEAQTAKDITKTPTNMIWRFRFCFSFGPFIKNVISPLSSPPSPTTIFIHISIQYHIRKAFQLSFFLKMCVHGRWKVYVSVSNTVSHIGDDPTSLTLRRRNSIIEWCEIRSLRLRDGYR